MIHVEPQPEPLDFDSKVRQPGRAFLKQHDHGSIPWREGRYWRECLPDLRKAYNNLCSYLAMWVMSSDDPNDPHPSVEHFVPKSARPDLAYEWSNYRLASGKANSDRGQQEVMDPFLVKDDWFQTDPFTGEIHVAESVDEATRKKLDATIAAVRLNDAYWTRLRRTYWSKYIELMHVEPMAARSFFQTYAPVLLREASILEAALASAQRKPGA